MTRIAIAVSLMLTLSTAANDLTGTVVDANAKPVAGAHVYVYAAFPKFGPSTVCPSCYRDCGKQDQVDANGGFRISGLDPSLVFDVLAVAEGYEPEFARKTDPTLGPVTIALKPRPAVDAHLLISGTVVDPEGKPVIGAAVEPRGYHDPSRGIGYGNIPGVDKLSITNGIGEFALRIPDATGKLDVRVTARSLAPRIDRLLVPGQPRRIALTPGTAMTGRVVRDGQPVAGAWVTIVQLDRNSANYLGLIEIATNEHGLFAMPNLAPNETYHVSAQLAGGVVAPKIVKTGADDTDVDAGMFSAVPGRRVSGTVVMQDGERIPRGAQLVLRLRETGTAVVTAVMYDGTFAFAQVPATPATLTVGNWDLCVSPRSTGYDEEEAKIVVPEEGDYTGVTVVLAR